MKIWDGKIYDRTDRNSNRFLEINSCGFQNTDSGYTVIRKTGRNDYHILLINSGICQVLHSKKEHILTGGCLVIYAPGEEQRYSFKAESTSLWCHFTGTIVEELFAECEIKSGVYLFRPNKNLSEAYTKLIRCYHQPAKEKYAKAALIELLYCISEENSAFSQYSNNDILLPILTYINANYSGRISLEELAKRSGYSKSRFSHIFSEITGTTPIRYQNDIRLKVSCEMLVSTDYPVSQIAIECGFNDPLYYSKIFKKKYGISPSAYRQKMNSQ